MTTSIVDAESVLAIDLGSAHTRAVLFDVVDGQYRFIASGMAPCTLNAPFQDVEESIHQALGQLTEVTGREFVDPESMQLILPTRAGGQGADCLVVTYSAGPDLRIVTAGLLGDVSLDSAQRLVYATAGKVVESIGLTDHRRTDVQLDAILKAEPDIIILTGGTENGATRSVFKLVDVINLALRVMPQESRPQVLYAGNQVLGKKIKEVLDNWTPVTLASNVRPSIDKEDLDPAREALARVVTEVRYKQMGGLQRLAEMSIQPPMPTSYAFGRIVRFLSKLYDPIKGVLGVDVGSSRTIIAAGNGGELALNEFPYGTGAGAAQLLRDEPLESIMQWLPAGITAATARDYLWQKSLYPGSIPVTAEALAIEQAAVRCVLQLAVRQLIAHHPSVGMAFEPILASGAALSGAPTPAQALLMLLDGVQPVGVTTLILDQNNLIPSLGAISANNPVLPVQLLEFERLPEPGHGDLPDQQGPPGHTGAAGGAGGGRGQQVAPGRAARLAGHPAAAPRAIGPHPLAGAAPDRDRPARQARPGQLQDRRRGARRGHRRTRAAAAAAERRCEAARIVEKMGSRLRLTVLREQT